MTLLWFDGFDHYGADESFMLDGLYAQVSASMTLSTEQVRTGTRSLSGGGFIRYVLPFGGREVVAIGMALFLNQLPNINERMCIYQGRDSANVEHVTVTVMTTGAVRAVRGSTVLGESLPAITAAAWHHVETRVAYDGTNGTVEVRVNGVTVLDLAGVDTLDTGDSLCHQVVIGEMNPTSATMWIDDLFIWDGEGARNNDFLGDKAVLVLTDRPAEAVHATQMPVLALAEHVLAARATQAPVLVLCAVTDCLTHWAQCWRIERRDGEVFAFTTHDRPVPFGGETYRPCDSLAAGATALGAMLDQVGNAEIAGVLSDDAIREDELLAGLFDGALVEVWMVPWAPDEG